MRGGSIVVSGELGGGAEVGEDALADRDDEGDRGAAVADTGDGGRRVDAADDHVEEDAARILAGEGIGGELPEQAGDHVLQGQRRAQDLLDQLAGQLAIDRAAPYAPVAIDVGAPGEGDAVYPVVAIHAAPSRRRRRSLPPEGAAPSPIRVPNPRSGYKSR